MLNKQKQWVFHQKNSEFFPPTAELEKYIKNVTQYADMDFCILNMEFEQKIKSIICISRYILGFCELQILGFAMKKNADI